MNRFSIYAWLLLAYNLLVVLWGALVRATGSGAGCGNHWPTCNGEVIPRAEQLDTLIEWTHRLSTGLDGLLVIGLFVWASLRFQRRHPARLAAGASLVLVVLEGLIGAGLVRLELVADNASLARAWWIAGHLVNTLILLGCLAATAWWAWRPPPLVRFKADKWVWLFATGLLGMLLLGMSGAVAALGDTLFPAQSLQQGLQQDFSPAANQILRLRVFHPLIAVLVSLFWLVLLALSFPGSVSPGRLLARGAFGLIVLQLFAGVINILLLAPIWMQLVHLLLADLIWIALVLFTLSNLVEAQPVRAVQALRNAASLESP